MLPIWMHFCCNGCANSITIPQPFLMSDSNDLLYMRIFKYTMQVVSLVYAFFFSSDVQVSYSQASRAS